MDNENLSPEERTRQANRESWRTWREKNPDKYREYQKKWRKQNPEKQREYHKKWRDKNPDKVKAAREGYWIRRAMKILEAANQGGKQ